MRRWVRSGSGRARPAAHGRRYGAAAALVPIFPSGQARNLQRDQSVGNAFSQMAKDEKAANQIAQAIKERAVQFLGPWPRDLELFIFGLRSGWSCGLSPVTQTGDIEYREAVRQIARELRETIQLVR